MWLDFDRPDGSWNEWDCDYATGYSGVCKKSFRRPQAIAGNFLKKILKTKFLIYLLESVRLELQDKKKLTFDNTNSLKDSYLESSRGFLAGNGKGSSAKTLGSIHIFSSTNESNTGPNYTYSQTLLCVRRL